MFRSGWMASSPIFTVAPKNLNGNWFSDPVLGHNNFLTVELAPSAPMRIHPSAIKLRVSVYWSISIQALGEI